LGQVLVELAHLLGDLPPPRSMNQGWFQGGSFSMPPRKAPLSEIEVS
jgi:hypothetical protein